MAFPACWDCLVLELNVLSGIYHAKFQSFSILQSARRLFGKHIGHEPICCIVSRLITSSRSVNAYKAAAGPKTSVFMQSEFSAKLERAVGDCADLF